MPEEEKLKDIKQVLISEEDLFYLHCAAYKWLINNSYDPNAGKVLSALRSVNKPK